MADPDGNEPVPFDDATADALTEAFDAAADDLDAQTASRASLVTTASTDFRGLFSELFASNADTARQGASNLAECLRTVASFAGDLKQAAKEENTRRRLAREWQQRMDDRNGVEVVLQDIFGSEPPPRGEQKAAPVMPPVDVSVGSRETPAPGSGGGGGGGTSSARPDDLRSFATGSVGLNAQFSGRPGELDGTLADFASQCEWGAIDASGVTSAFATKSNPDGLLSNKRNEMSRQRFLAAGGPSYEVDPG